MIAQNASLYHDGSKQPQSFGRVCTIPADALEDAKAVLAFLDAAVCAALSDRSAELNGQQVFGLSLVFQATLASLDYATTGMRTGHEQDAYGNGFAAGLEEGKRLSAMGPYPRFDPAPDPERKAPPHAAAG
ncbi:hypothetical protein [Azospirillum doebereinerae]